MKLTSKLKKYVVKEGRKAGYKECCIKSFVTDLKKGKPSAIYRKASPKGYIPCPSCSKKIGLKSLTKKQIKNNIYMTKKYGYVSSDYKRKSR